MALLQIVNSLTERGYQLTKTAVALCHNVADTSAHRHTTDATINAHLSLAKYCDHFLRQKEAGEITHYCYNGVLTTFASVCSCSAFVLVSLWLILVLILTFSTCMGLVWYIMHVDDTSIDCASMSSFPAAIVTSLLRAMTMDSSEACQRFPRLLSIVELYPDTMNAFIRLVNLGRDTSMSAFWKYILNKQQDVVC